MNLRDVIAISKGEILTPQLSADAEIFSGCCADLMSDVLAYSRPQAVLLTGLINPQVVRTAQVADVRAIVFAHDKQPPPETLAIAVQENIFLIRSPMSMYELSGKLYAAGLRSCDADERA
ncbi:MAG: hypothetical protein LC099_06295 [Anaerolineales bacterium]|nr:hypothetical protein [Anaerolineales bacterium]